MLLHGKLNWQSTNWAEVPLRPVVSLAIQLLVLELCCALLACSLVLLAVGPLAVHAAVFHEAAGRAVLELDGLAPVFAAVGAGFVAPISISSRHTIHDAIGVIESRCLVKWRLGNEDRVHVRK